MADLFHVDIASPDKLLYSADAVSLVVPAELGYLGILANHAPLIANLKKGRITLRDPSGKENIFYSNGKGIIEVLDNRATLLFESKLE